jgi:anti-sigma-K factor RskA
MAYIFEGQKFRTIADWQRAFPAYKSFYEDLKTGADTAMEMERRIAQRRKAARIKSREAAQRQNKPRGMTK